MFAYSDAFRTVVAAGRPPILHRLRTELHQHQLVGSMFYGEGRTRLDLGVLTVWSSAETPPCAGGRTSWRNLPITV
ncbi:hypothetical protein [Streptosporangium sp. V21-05]|uniref:hypothetical protein n=1 Tax=Streptosporangium sp. V21-05 TaxID=3446115 RepID=UPI003F531025